MSRCIFGRVVLLGLLVAGGAPAALAADAGAAARALAGERQAGLEALTRTAPDNSTIPGYQGTSVPQAGYTPGTLASPQSVTRDPVLDNAETALNAAPDQVTLDPGKYTAPLDIQDTPGTRFDLDRLLSGSYADCAPATTPSSQSQTHRCDAWRQTAASSCHLDRQVDVEASLDYRCDEDSARIHKTCERVLSRQCGRTGLCNTAGLRLESLQSDYGATIQPDGLILIGRAGTRSWCGDQCTTRTRNVRFTVNDRSAVRVFKVVNGGFDDWIHIRLNGHLVWVGHGAPSSGPIYVECLYAGTSWSWYCGHPAYNVVKQNGSVIGGCERKTHWSIPQIDLRPWLIEGQNHLEIRIISTGCGDGYLRLQAQSSCCDAWQDSWSETCN